MKVMKLLGIVVGALVAFVLLAGVAVSLFFDPNDYRSEIGNLVQENTGRTLEIDGDLKLSVFPWLAVEVGSARLSESPDFGDQPFVEIKAARAGIRLLPLLSKQVQISELRLDGLRLRLLIDKNGKANWEDLAGGSTAAEPRATSQAGSQQQVLDELEIGSIVINDAALVWQDLEAGSSMELTEFGLSTGPVKLGEPVDLAVGFLLAIDKDQAMRVQLESRLESDRSLSALEASNLVLSLDLTGPDLPGGAMQVSGTVTSVNLGLEDGALSVKGLQVKALGANLEAELSGRQVMSDKPQISGRLSVPSMSPRDLLARLGSPLLTSDPKVMSEFSLQSDLSYDGKTAKLENLKASLDQTHLNGQFSVVDLTRQALSFDLAVDAIDLDRYLPPTEEDAGAKTDEAGTDTDIDTSGLKTLNARGQLRVGQLTLSGLVFTDARVNVNAADGVLRLHPITTRFYGGEYAGDVRLDASGDQPSLSLNERLTGVQLAPVLKVLSDHEFVSGSAGGGFTLSATGKTVKGMLASLTGNLDLAVTEGALEGVDLMYELQRAQALLAKQVPQARTGEARTAFDAMKVTGKVDKGVISSDDLDISTAVLKISGAGTVSLVEQNLDYRLKALVQEAPPADATQDLGQLRGATIPLRIGGTLSDPKVSVDMQDVLVDQAKKELQDAVMEKLKKKLFKN
ncbi:MAG: AsmA family protein [Gammaproteobacteria bacterium]|nr:AsmA family protein [Gammaproteobacteria bacterium]